MGKRQRSVASEANDSEGEGQSATSQPRAKRACLDKWNFPEELKNAVSAALQLEWVGINWKLSSLFTDAPVSEVVRFPSQGKGRGEQTTL